MSANSRGEKSEFIEGLASIYRKTLPSDWEVYQEPYLNGATPDLVALHARHGVCLILLEPLHLSNPELRWENRGLPVIRQETQNSLSTYQIPLPRLDIIGREVATLYGFRLGRPLSGAIAPITVGVVYPNLTIDLSSAFSRVGGKRQYDLFCLTAKQISGEVPPEVLVPQLRNETVPDRVMPKSW